MVGVPVPASDLDPFRFYRAALMESAQECSGQFFGLGRRMENPIGARWRQMIFIVNGSSPIHKRGHAESELGGIERPDRG